MKIPKERIEKAVSTDESRVSICNVFLENGNLVATDGRQMVVVTQESDPADVDGMIPTRVFGIARQMGATTVRVGKKFFTFKDKAGEKVMSIQRPAYDIPFPNWRQLMDSRKKEKPTITIALNPTLLYKVAQALSMGNQELFTMKIFGEKDPIQITTTDGRVALVMPGTLSPVVEDVPFNPVKENPSSASKKEVDNPPANS